MSILTKDFLDSEFPEPDGKFSKPEQVEPAAPEADMSRDVVGPMGSAINSEEETIVFYKDLLDMFPDFAPVLKDIIAEEEKHIGQLEVLRNSSSSEMTKNIEKGVEEAEHQLETGSSEEPDDLGEAEVEADEIAIDLPEEDTTEDEKSRYIDDILNEDASKKKFVYEGPIYDDYGMVVRDGKEWVYADDKQAAVKALINQLKKAFKSSHIHIEPQNIKEVSPAVTEDINSAFGYDDFDGEIAAMRDEQKDRERQAANKASNPKVEPGDKIRIIDMAGESHYAGRTGEVEHIDDMGQIHGTWGGCAIIPEEDTYELITENINTKVTTLKEAFSRVLNEDLNSSYKPMLNHATAADFVNNFKDFATSCIDSSDIKTLAYICRVAILKLVYDAKAWWQNKQGEIAPIDIARGGGTIGITKGSSAKLDFTIGDAVEVYRFTQNNAEVKLIDPNTQQEDVQLLRKIIAIKKWYEHAFMCIVEPEKLAQRIAQRQQNLQADLEAGNELEVNDTTVDRWYALGWLAKNVTKIFAIIPERGDFESIFLSFNPDAKEDVGYTVKPDGLTSGGFPNLYTYMFLVHFKRSAIQQAPAGVIDYLSRFGSQVKNPMSCNRLALNLVNNYGFNFGDIDNDAVYDACLKMVPGEEERNSFNAGFGILPEDPTEQDPDFGNIDSIEDDIIPDDSVEECLKEASYTPRETFTLSYDKLATLDLITEKPILAPYDYVCDLDDLVEDFYVYDLLSDVTQEEADKIVAILGITEDEYYDMDTKELHKLLAEHFAEVYEVVKDMLLNFYREDAEEASISEVLDDGEDISDEDEWDD